MKTFEQAERDWTARYSFGLTVTGLEYFLSHEDEAIALAEEIATSGSWCVPDTVRGIYDAEVLYLASRALSGDVPDGGLRVEVYVEVSGRGHGDAEPADPSAMAADAAMRMARAMQKRFRYRDPGVTVRMADAAESGPDRPAWVAG